MAKATRIKNRIRELRFHADEMTQAELARLGLNDHLSAQRSNGLRAMVQRIRDISEHAAAA